MQVPLVPLYNQGEIGDILVHTPELLLEFVPTLDVLLQFARLRVCDKDHAVGAAPSQSPRGQGYNIT